MCILSYTMVVNIILTYTVFNFKLRRETQLRNNRKPKKLTMKIGIEAQRLFRNKKHGMDIVALELIKALQKLDTNHQFYIYLKPDTDNSIIQASQNFEIIEVAGGSYPLWEQYKLPLAARKHHLDVLHCTANTAPLFAPAPLVLTLHDVIYLEKLNLKRGTMYQRLGNLYRRWNVPRVVNLAEKIITVSDFERMRILEHFGLPGERVVTIYNAVGNHFIPVTDKERLAAKQKKYNLPDEYMLFLGNTDPKKNVAGLLKALWILKKENQLTLPVVITDLEQNYLQQTLQELKAHELEKDIVLCGYIPNYDLPAVYSKASVFLYPSLRESFGIPILEGMACGVPVITSNTASMPEVAGNAALFVDPFLPTSIAQEISSLLNDTEKREALIEKGYARAANFSWEKTAQKVVELYEMIP